MPKGVQRLTCYTSGTLKSAQNLLPVYQLLYIVTNSHFDCESIFCHCYDVWSLCFVTVMTFMRIMVVIVVLALLNF